MERNRRVKTLFDMLRRFVRVLAESVWQLAELDKRDLACKHFMVGIIPQTMQAQSLQQSLPQTRGSLPEEFQR
jgi:hypothetical protein